MKSILCFAMIFTVFAAKAAFGGTATAQCAPVNCDCEALDELSWRSECEAQELRVQSQCGAPADGTRLYCGAHGPSAFPVATSIHAANLDLELNDGSQFLLRRANTQSWSLKETYNTFRASVEKRNLGQAIQLSGLVDAEAQRLFSVHKQAIIALGREGKGQDAPARALEFGKAHARHAAVLFEYSEHLWHSGLGAAQDRELRGLRILSFKAARAAAASYEFAGDLAADGEAIALAADYWQRSAVIAQRLIEWESSADRNTRHLSFYRSQAASRWHRATFYWYQLRDLQRAATASDYARAYSASSQESADELPLSSVQSAAQELTRNR